MLPREFELHIDELVLNGITVRDQRAFGIALQAELQRLFTERGMPSSLQQGTTLTGLDGGILNVADSRADKLGTQVAGHLYQGLTRHSRSTTS